MILHAKYENGKVTVTDKNIPEGKSDAIVRLVPRASTGDGLLSLAGIWADRTDMEDSTKWVNDLRQKEDKRSRS